MILQTSVLALASALVAGTLTFASVAPSPESPTLSPVAMPQSGDSLTVHLATSSPPAPPTPTIYDSLGHVQVSPQETYCDAHEKVVQGLTEDFAETFKAERVSNDGLRIELWASELMGTWTALHHGNDGVSCIVASGVDWSESVQADDLLQIAVHEVVYNW